MPAPQAAPPVAEGAPPGRGETSPAGPGAGAPLLVTVNVKSVVPELPSALVTSSTESFGAASSLVIEPSPVPSSTLALVTVVVLSETRNSSLGSKTASPQTFTVKVWVVTFGAKVSVAVLFS